VQYANEERRLKTHPAIRYARTAFFCGAPAGVTLGVGTTVLLFVVAIFVTSED
jgi:hypothetical protein